MTNYMDVEGNALTKEEYEKMQKAGFKRKEELKSAEEDKPIKDKKK